MSTLYSIDGSAVTDPTRLAWDAPTELGIDHTQTPIYGAYRTATARFNTLTIAQITSWLDADDGGYHTVICPDPSGSFTAFSGVIVRFLGAEHGASNLLYNATFRLERLTL